MQRSGWDASHPDPLHKLLLLFGGEIVDREGSSGLLQQRLVGNAV